MKHTFRLSVAGHSERVGGQRCLHLGIVEVNHGTITFYHIHLHGIQHNVNKLCCHMHQNYPSAT